ncbi:hypothetical protein [Paramaledivibacter caminithermalis]|jgi:hypothetical protein|uniref:Uncharacterized protein n=1 Tax=Paramaledivibacter caminithermalis (strain DSM 15212 / CIP 107654 / DViRD3) TaxID=1121301 RepID=A0A1M6NQ49_PARC5|nr:hypothetical protein [Paramaledivibacter caminithermalis]SHJ97794.1 hypothetical protein SAMN02745912_01819 [Paramaledivibacter caminithermalis DSM 15212]
MAITIYNDFESFSSITDKLSTVNFNNLPLENTNSYYYHHVRPLIIPNPLVLEGIKLTSPCFLFSSYDENLDSDVIYVGENSKIDFSQNTFGIMLKVENKEKCILKVTDYNDEVLLFECEDLKPYISVGFSSPNGISSIQFLNSNTFLCSMLFAQAINQ